MINILSSEQAFNIGHEYRSQCDKGNDRFGFGINDIPTEFRWAFIGGIFSTAGWTGKIEEEVACSIRLNDLDMRDDIAVFSNIPCENTAEPQWNINGLLWRSNNALDFVGKIYCHCKDLPLYNKGVYKMLSESVSGLSEANRISDNFKCMKIDSRACLPSKTLASDSGYDITLIDVEKNFGQTTLYKTGIKIQPAFGWYFDLVPRSSIIKTGYIMANSPGIIDRTYKGEILVALTKIDSNMPTLPLPCKIMQIIPRPIINIDFEEVDQLDSSQRNAGGFGSTDARS
jgi:deoxyuridine 5'-triphosphate nucleotidohydrolase